MLEGDESNPSSSCAGESHEASRKERAKAARRQAYDAAKERAARQRQAAKTSPQALARKEALRERARAARKEAYARAKEKMAAERQASKKATRRLKDEERQRKDSELRANLQLGSELAPSEPRAADEEKIAKASAKPARPRGHLRLVPKEDEA